METLVSCSSHRGCWNIVGIVLMSPFSLEGQNDLKPLLSELGIHHRERCGVELIAFAKLINFCVVKN